jgi:predicted unusual protein kinase regulating ubiquinone biosynthesis (AarF/ABC1/UbiB family)
MRVHRVGTPYRSIFLKNSQKKLEKNSHKKTQHPGNMLVTLDPPSSGPRGLAIRGVHALRVALGLAAGRSAPDASWCPRAWLVPSLVLLDVGMTSRLSETHQARMVALFTAFARGDGAGVAQNALLFADPGGQTCADPASFEADMAAYFQALDAERARIAATGAPPLDGGKALAGVLELVRTHRVALPGVVASILVAVLVLEGWSSRLDPHYSPIQAVEALVAPETTRAGRVAAALVEHLDDAAGVDARLDEW